MTFVYVQTHKADQQYLNRRIEFYTELESLYADRVAGGEGATAHPPRRTAELNGAQNTELELEYTFHPESSGEPTPMSTGRTEPTQMSTGRTVSREATRSINSRRRTGTNELAALLIEEIRDRRENQGMQTDAIDNTPQVFNAIMRLEGHEYDGYTFT